MMMGEAQIWRDYRETHPHAYNRVWFDALIPRDTTQPPSVQDKCCDPAVNCDRAWIGLNSLRADVIAESVDGYTIIELRWNPTEDNYGRLLRYDWIARKVWPDRTWLSPVIMCRQPPRIPLSGGEWDRIQTIVVPYSQAEAASAS